MKNKITVLAMSLMAMLWLATGCNQTSSSSGSGSGDKVRLELNLEKGQTFNRVNKMEQEISMKVMGMSNDMEQDMDFFIKQEVVNVGEDGISDIKVTYDRIRYSIYMSMLGTAMEYDSDKEDNGDNPMAAAMEPLVGASFTMKMDKTGKVVDIIGMDEIMDEIAKNAGGGPGDMSNTFDAENMKKTMQNMMAIYPDVLVGEGDTWGAETELSGEYPLALEMTYKVEKVESEKVFLNVDGKITTTDDAEVAGGMGSFEMNGTQGGTLEIDRKTGMVERADFTQDVSGEVKTMGMNSPIEIESKIVIEPY